MMLQLNSPLPLRRREGDGLAHLVIDYGIDWELMWTVIIDETGESWTYRNSEIRGTNNITLGRVSPSV